MYFCLDFRLVSDDIRFVGFLAKTKRTSIHFERGQKRKYYYGVPKRSIYAAPVNGRGRM